MVVWKLFIIMNICPHLFLSPSDIIHGKLFQNTRILEVDYAQGRDIPPGYTGKIVETLQAWVNSCDSVSNCIDMQIKYANGEKAKRLYNKERIEQEVSELKALIIGHSVLSKPLHSSSSSI